MIMEMTKMCDDDKNDSGLWWCCYRNDHDDSELELEYIIYKDCGLGSLDLANE